MNHWNIWNMSQFWSMTHGDERRPVTAWHPPDAPKAQRDDRDSRSGLRKLSTSYRFRMCPIWDFGFPAQLARVVCSVRVAAFANWILMDLDGKNSSQQLLGYFPHVQSLAVTSRREVAEIHPDSQ